MSSTIHSSKVQELFQLLKYIDGRCSNDERRRLDKAIATILEVDASVEDALEIFYGDKPEQDDRHKFVVDTVMGEHWMPLDRDDGQN